MLSSAVQLGAKDLSTLTQQSSLLLSSPPYPYSVVPATYRSLSSLAVNKSQIFFLIIFCILS